MANDFKITITVSWKLLSRCMESVFSFAITAAGVFLTTIPSTVAGDYASVLADPFVRTAAAATIILGLLMGGYGLYRFVNMLQPRFVLLPRTKS